MKKRWTVSEYIREEVRRQGHDLNDPQDGGIRVLWMEDAWQTATREAAQGKIPTVEVIEQLGRILEPQKNERGFRTCGVRVGSRICPPWETVRPALKELVASIERNGKKLDPLEWYKQFELLHPFVDANGRAGKILLAWLAGTLDRPFFPPNDLFGDWIANP